MAQPSALQAALSGQKVEGKAAQSALSQAVSKITGLERKASMSKEAMVATGEQALHTAETQGSLFLSSLLEGFVGPEKMKVGGVDVRAPIGVLSIGYGLYETATTGKGGEHALALGNGVTGSWLATVGRDAGQLLAEKRKGGATPAPAQPAPNTPQMQGFQGASPALGALPPPPPGYTWANPNPVAHHAAQRPQVLMPAPQVAGPAREVLLTPHPEAGPEVGRSQWVRPGQIRLTPHPEPAPTQAAPTPEPTTQGDFEGPLRRRVAARRMNQDRPSRFPWAQDGDEAGEGEG